jgi:hypothetical protein
MTSFFRGAARALGWDSTEHVDSPEFTSKLHNFKEHIDEIQKVRDAMQLYSDAVEATIAAQVVLGDALDSYYKSSCKTMTTEQKNNPPACHNVAQAFKKATLEMYGHVRPAVHEVFVSRCVRPVTFILSRVPAVHEQISQRKKLIASFHEVQATIDSHKDSGSLVLAKHEAKLHEVTIELGHMDSTLTSTLDEFSESRPKMLAQELASVVACSYHQSNMLCDQLSVLLPLLPQAASSLCLLQAAAATREKKVNKNLSNDVSASILNSLVCQINEDGVILERGKFSGGRAGGYGLISRTKSNSRRRSLNSARLPQLEQEQQKADILEQDSSSEDDAPVDLLDRRDVSIPPAKPPRELSTSRGGVRISSQGGVVFAEALVNEATL